MKKYILGLIAFIAMEMVFIFSLIAQEGKPFSEHILEDVRQIGIDPNNRQQVLDSLNSSNIYTRSKLYYLCGLKKITEALPVLKQNYYKYPYTTSRWGNIPNTRLHQERNHILGTVEEMNGDGFQQEFRMELDSMKNYLVKDNSMFLRFASYLMKKYNDDYGFNTMVSIYTKKENLEEAWLYPLYLEPFYNSPYKTEVIEALRYVCKESSEDDTRASAFEALQKIHDPGLSSFAYELSKNDSMFTMRHRARCMLVRSRSPLYLISMIDAIKEELDTTGNILTFRLIYYRVLLESRQLWAYKYVLDLFKGNIYPADQTNIHSLLENYKYDVLYSFDADIKEQMDSVRNSLSQLQIYNWLGNNNFIAELNGYLASAKNKLAINDSINCARQIKSFQQAIDREYRDSANSTPAFVTIEGWKFLYYNAQYILDHLPQTPPDGCNVKLVNSAGTKLTGGTLQYYDGAPEGAGWKDAVNNNNGTFFVNTTRTTLSLRMTYEYGTQTKSNVAIGNDTVAFQTVNAQIQLQNSNGTLIDTGSVQYYAGAWRVLGTTINGTASKELLPANYSFRMTYAYASKDKQQDISVNATVVFQTVNTTVQLQNSQGSLIDQGTVQYYSGAWRNFGTTSNGVANKELLPNNYSFRMTYEYASKDKQQDLSTNSIVIFQTVNAAVQLQNSQGALVDQGTVQYYSGAWRSFGNTTNGVANKELLPNNYSFRMTYEYASKDKLQDLSTNPTVIFQTVNAAVQLQNSQGSLIDQGTVQYYSGAWRSFGTTSNGVANKELLPNNYSFRMTYEYASKDKQQDLNTNPTVVFQTVNAQVQLKNSQSVLMPSPSGDLATVQYYSGAWRNFGTTTNGIATKDLLPNTYSFRMTYEYASIGKQQDLSSNSTVDFSTVLCTIRVRNSQDQLVDDAFASYYSGAWRLIGKTINGQITKELLPINLSFRAKYGTQQLDKQQNLSTNNVVEFGIQ
jgi:hypothetical protein